MQIGVDLGRTDHGINHFDPGGLPPNLAEYSRLNGSDVEGRMFGALFLVWLVNHTFVYYSRGSLRPSHHENHDACG